LANRCGIGPFTTGPNDPMTPACAKHDQRYIENKLYGGERLRKIIDKKFLHDMLSIAKDKKSLKLRLQSIIYYVLARSFGWIPWYFNKKNGL